MTKHLFDLKFSDPEEPQCKEDIRVARILWFALGFIAAVVFIYLTLP